MDVLHGVEHENDRHGVSVRRRRGVVRRLARVAQILAAVAKLSGGGFDGLVGVLDDATLLVRLLIHLRPAVPLFVLVDLVWCRLRCAFPLHNGSHRTCEKLQDINKLFSLIP